MRKVYTRDEAANIIEMFEDILLEHGIHVPSPEDDMRDPGDMNGLYGSVYDNLLDDVENELIHFAVDVIDAEIVPDVFNGPGGAVIEEPDDEAEL